MRLSGVMDSDQGVAVAALVEQRQFQLQGCPPIALGNDARARCAAPVAVPPKAYGRVRRRLGMGDRGTQDRIDERRYVPARGMRSRADGGPPRSRRSTSRLRRIAAIAAAEESTSVASDGAPRQRLDAPARPIPRTGRAPARRRPSPRIENSASRTRSPVGRVARPGARPACARRIAPRSPALRPPAAHARIGAAASVP